MRHGLVFPSYSSKSFQRFGNIACHSSQAIQHAALHLAGSKSEANLNGSITVLSVYLGSLQRHQAQHHNIIH